MIQQIKDARNIIINDENEPEHHVRLSNGECDIDRLAEVVKTLNEVLLPTIHAKVGDPPEKPPPMKYTDLPLYKAPHYEYKDYIADKDKCPKANVKLVQENLLPYVKDFRQGIQESYKEVTTEFGLMKKELCDAMRVKKNKFKAYMRDPANLLLRQTVVAVGGATGFYLARKGIPRRIFFTSVGLLATGALCFPKETDLHFRNTSYCVGKIVTSMYNGVCRKRYTMRARMCEPSVQPTKQSIINQCDKK